METIGERLKFFRKKKNMTQGELAIALGVTAGFISKIESGLQEPSEPIIKLLEYSYGLNKEWLLTGKGEMYYASCGGEPPEGGEPQYPKEKKEVVEVREPIAPYEAISKDSRLSALHQKLESIYKEGDLDERIKLLGTIEVLYDEIKKKKTLPGKEVIEQKKVG